MLILTRRPHESIRLGSRIRITVLGFKGNQIRIGIEAPPEVTIDREEVWERKQQEAQQRVTANANATITLALASGDSVAALDDEAGVP